MQRPPGIDREPQLSVLRQEVVLTDTPDIVAGCSPSPRCRGQHMHECYRAKAGLRAERPVKGGAKFAENLSNQQPLKAPAHKDCLCKVLWKDSSDLWMICLLSGPAYRHA